MSKRMGIWFWIVLCIISSPAISLGNNGFSVDMMTQNARDSVLTFTITDYGIYHYQNDQNTFSVIDFKGGVKTKRKGFAELPFIHATIRLPPNGNPVLEAIPLEYEDIPLDYPMLPSKGIVYRNQNPLDLDYEIAEESLIDQWYPELLAVRVDPFIFRDIRGTNIYVYPFRYNAQERILRVYKKVEVRVHIDFSETKNPLYRKSDAILPVMEMIYDSLFINYTPARDRLIGEAGDILVIATSRDVDAVAPFVQWKREKGFTTHLRIVESGVNVKDIIREEYELHPNLLYVQLVGDWDDIQSDLGTEEDAPMDPTLGCIIGDDEYPDLIVGRFSANSTGQVAVQVSKSIEYEKNPEMSASWYQSGLGIGSEEGEGFGDDGEADYQHIDLIKEYKLLPFTYQDIGEIYQEGSDASSVQTAVENGLSIINYCGHGDEFSWTTTGFSTNEIVSLSNSSRLPVILSVACLNGAFHYAEDCFAESWLRRENGGAVAALMSTVLQPWQPPMRGQDYINDLLTDGYDYENNPGNGISTIEGRTTLGSIILNGLLLMYTESSDLDDLRTIQTWTVFGDVSLQIRTNQPLPIHVTNQQVIPGETFSTKVLSEHQEPVAGAIVALQQDGQVFTALTDDSGSVEIDHQIATGPATLVVSGFNLETQYIPISLGDSYCTSGGKNQDFEYIKCVRIGSFSNASGASAYSDFTGQIIEMNAGGMLDVRLTPGFTSDPFKEKWRIWIDFNQDGDFNDEGERVFQGSGKSVVSGSISIPETATAGVTRMRLSMRFGRFAPCCGMFQYGEVEDYSVQISKACSQP